MTPTHFPKNEKFIESLDDLFEPYAKMNYNCWLKVTRIEYIKVTYSKTHNNFSFFTSPIIKTVLMLNKAHQ